MSSLQFILDKDTTTSKDTFENAVMAVGGVIALVDAVVKGKCQNGFALVRPAGHHAERDHAVGGCFFNNIAIGERYAQRVLGIKKVMILDWDINHGNGTQHIFYEDSSVFYISIRKHFKKLLSFLN